MHYWPFLIGASRRFDYRTLISPDFVEELKPDLFRLALDPRSYASEDQTLSANVDDPKLGRVTIFYRTEFVRDASKPDQFVYDGSGRRIYFIHGIVTRPDRSDETVNQTQADAFIDAHRDDAMAHLRRFMASETRPRVVLSNAIVGSGLEIRRPPPPPPSPPASGPSILSRPLTPLGRRTESSEAKKVEQASRVANNTAEERTFELGKMTVYLIVIAVVLAIASFIGNIYLFREMNSHRRDFMRWSGEQPSWSTAETSLKQHANDIATLKASSAEHQTAIERIEEKLGKMSQRRQDNPDNSTGNVEGNPPR